MPRQTVCTHTLQFWVQVVRCHFPPRWLGTAQYHPACPAAAGQLHHFISGQPKEWQMGCYHPPHHLPHSVLSGYIGGARVASIISQGREPVTPLSYVSAGVHVIASQITALLHQAATNTNLVAQGYTLKRIGSYLLPAFGTMALKLQGY